MEEMVLRRNNLPLLFSHFDSASTGGAKGKVAQSSHRSPDLVSFVYGGRRSVLSRWCWRRVLWLCLVSCSGRVDCNKR